MEHTVTQADDGIRLDRWFKRRYPGVQQALLEKHLRKGQIRVDGAKAKASARIAAGQVILYPDMLARATDTRLRKAVQPDGSAQREAQGWVLYKDDDVIAINKPAGLAVQGGSGQTRHVDGLLDGLRFEAAERPRLTHRLDRDTSGVLLLGRGANAAAKLAKRFAAHDLQKIYVALVRGVPRPAMGTIDLPLAKEARGKHSREKVEAGGEHGKDAVTEYRVLEGFGGKLALVELVPVTGRTHQLRVHMAAIGHPIVGDGKYGGKLAFVDEMGLEGKLHLHARRIVLPRWHGKTLEITAPLPEHMQASLELLGGELK